VTRLLLAPAWLLSSLLLAAPPDVPRNKVEPRDIAAARLHGAQDSLDELETLLAEVRALCVTPEDDQQGSPWFPQARSLRSAAAPRSLNVEHLGDLGEQIAERRRLLAGLEEKLAAADGPQFVYREAGLIVRWAAETGAPLHALVQARRRTEVDRLREQTDVAWTVVTGLGHDAGDPLLGEAGRRRFQARAAWADGDLLAAQRHYESLLGLCRGLEAQAEQRRTALEARAEVELARRWAVTHQAERLAAPLWQPAEQLRAAAEAAAASHRYAAARRSWHDACRGYAQAEGVAERLAQLERARLDYELLVAGLADEDLETLGSRRQDMDHCVAYAEDERNDPESRTEHYRAAVRSCRPGVTALRLGKARALLEQGEEAEALDQLAAVLRQSPADAEARRLFNEVAARNADWWFARARTESYEVSDEPQRLVLYELLARTRRLIGDREGTARAVEASVALLRVRFRAGADPSPLIDLVHFCQDSEDRDAVRTLVLLAGEVVGQMPPGERGLWLSWLAGVAEHNGDPSLSARSLQEARRLVPGQQARLAGYTALGSRRPDQAASSWLEFARTQQGGVGAIEAADLGASILDAAAERGDRDLYRTIREPLRQCLARITHEASAEAIGRRLALADARMGDWSGFHILFGDGGDPALAEAAAAIEARHGNATAARRLLDLVEDRTVSRAAWLAARSSAAEPNADLAEVLLWIYELPDAASRCAAYLGVPAGRAGGGAD
jgi:hypothetical protein